MHRLYHAAFQPRKQCYTWSRQTKTLSLRWIGPSSASNASTRLELNVGRHTSRNDNSESRHSSYVHRAVLYVSHKSRLQRMQYTFNNQVGLTFTTAHHQAKWCLFRCPAQSAQSTPILAAGVEWIHLDRRRVHQPTRHTRTHKPSTRNE